MITKMTIEKAPTPETPDNLPAGTFYESAGGETCMILPRSHGMNRTRTLCWTTYTHTPYICQRPAPVARVFEEVRIELGNGGES